MKKYLNGIVLSAVIVCLVGCNNVQYSHYEKVPESGWHKDSVLVFEAEVTDTVNAYDVIVSVRHTQRYPYQNMWLFTEADMAKDTIEFYLADDYGRWLGNGYGRIKEMPVLLEHQVVFKHAGIYRYSVEQAMRDSILKGISDVGLIIQRSE